MILIRMYDFTELVDQVSFQCPDMLISSFFLDINARAGNPTNFLTLDLRRQEQMP